MSGRGEARKTLALVDKAIEIASEIQPASVRAICYRLFVAGFIDNMSRSVPSASRCPRSSARGRAFLGRQASKYSPGGAA